MANKTIKIFVDAHKFDHSLQGTSTYIKGLYNSLVEYDDIQITLCANDIDNLKSHFNNTKFRFIKSRYKSKYLRLALEYPYLIWKNKFDYAHFQYIVPPIKFCKYINTIHDLLFLEQTDYFPLTYRVINGSLFKLSSTLSDHILTVSEYSRHSISKLFKIHPKNISVTANAVHSSEIDYSDVLTKYNLEKFILYVSRFEPRKNHVGLLNAYLNAKLYEKGYKLVFVGSHKESIEIDALNLLKSNIPSTVEDKVIFLQGMSELDLYSLYNSSDCFVFPSYAEGFGIPPLEAAVHGTKVICSNLTAMSDYSFFKYLYNPISEDLSPILLDALEDRNYPFEEIKKEIERKYNWEEISGVLYRLITNSLGN